MTIDIQVFRPYPEAPCKQWPSHIPVKARLDFYHDCNKEHTVGFMGCPHTLGRGIVYIFGGYCLTRYLANTLGMKSTGLFP
jgi:hypothetical protein